MTILPEILYKYRDWNILEHRRILTEREIYFASPEELDKRYECKLPRDYDSISDEELRKFCFWEAAKTSKNNIAILMEMQRLYKSNLFHNLENRNKTEQKFNKWMNQRLSIFCSSESCENLTLWNEFSNYDKGFCIGLKSDFFLNHKIYGSSNNIDYYDESSPPKVPAISFSQNDAVSKMLKLIYSLPSKYEKEKEFRISKTDLSNRKVQYPKNALKKVILGRFISIEHKKEITELVKCNFPEAKIFQAVYDTQWEYFVFNEI